MGRVAASAVRTSYTARGVVVVMARCVKAHAKADDAFAESALMTFRAVASGVELSAIAQAAVAHGVGTYTCPAAVAYHARTGRALSLGGGLPVRDGVQVKVEKLQSLIKNMKTGPVDAVLSQATSTADAYDALCETRKRLAEDAAERKAEAVRDAAETLAGVAEGKSEGTDVTPTSLLQAALNALADALAMTDRTGVKFTEEARGLLTDMRDLLNDTLPASLSAAA